MAGLFQGDPIYGTKVGQTQETAPEFYTNYLQDIANLGQNAIQQGGIAGFSPLQQQALQMAPDVAFSGAGTLGAAGQLLGQAGATTAPDVVADYLNPYTGAVVNEMGRLQQRNIRENILPSLGGAAIGTGQFGSRRQQQVTGNVLRDLQSDLLGRQLGALSSGYESATKAAQTDLARASEAGRGLTTLGQEQQQLGLGGLKTLFEYGGKEQELGQRAMDYPMAQAQAFAKLMQGYKIPTGVVSQEVAPSGISSSPLSQIAGLVSAIGAFRPSIGSQPSVASKTVPVPEKKGGFIKAPMSLTHRGKGYRIGGLVR